MKKSVRGSIKTKTQQDKDDIVKDINKQQLWRLVTNTTIDKQTGEEIFQFEAWVDTEVEETQLWSDMKKHVDKHKLKSKIDRHECSHDEPHNTPCTIVEEYEAE